MVKAPPKLLIQCDFDGTVTKSDISFLLLDEFARGDWRHLLDDYMAGKSTVGDFNRQAFKMVDADKKTMIDFMRDKVEVRPGFQKFVERCRERGIPVVIVSNGLEFYIKEILKGIQCSDLEIHAARSRFHPAGMLVKYEDPNGVELNDSFKKTYMQLFLDNGYDVVYIGDGMSDLAPARHARYVFATRELLKSCRKANVDCIPFEDFDEIMKALEKIESRDA